jgi:CBS domain-containing protein
MATIRAGREADAHPSGQEAPMRCQDLMKTDVTCCTKDESVFDCANKMNEENVGFMPICEADHGAGHKLVGTLTDRDIVLRVVAFRGGRDPRSVHCGEVMSGTPISCAPDDDLSLATNLMAQHHISRICVCEGDILKGVISLSDIVQAERSRGADTLRRVSEREAPAVH